MKSKIKWWLNGIAAFILVVVVFLYLLVRPIIVQNIEPIITDAAKTKVNGTVTWLAIDLDPHYDLQFTQLSVKDENGVEILSAPYLTVGWTLSSMYDYLTKGTGIDSVVKSVTLEDPTLYVAENSNGEWNIQNIIKPSDNASPVKFTGKVVILNGNAKISLHDEGDFNFHNLKGNFQWNDKQEISGTMKGDFLDTPFDSKLNYTDEENFTIDVKTNETSLKSLQPLLKHVPQAEQKLSLEDGTAEVTNAKIRKSDGTLAYRIEGKVNHAALSYDTYTLADGAAFFLIANDRVEIHKFSAKVNDQKITGRGEVNFADGITTIQAEANLHNVQIEKIGLDVDAKGTLNGDIYVTGTLPDFAVSGNVRVQDGKYNDFIVRDGKVSFVYGDNKIFIPSLYAKLEEGEIRGQGDYDLTDKTYNVSAEFVRLDLGKLPIDAGVSGVISGHVTSSGSLANGSLQLESADGELEGNNLTYQDISVGHIIGFGNYSAANWHGLLQTQNASYQGITAENINGEFSGMGNNITIHYLNGNSGDGTFSVKGTYAPSALNLEVVGSNLDIAPLGQIANEDVSGTASFTAYISGSLDAPEGSGNIHIASGHIREFAFDHAEGDVVVGNNIATIKSFVVTGPEGTNTIEGSVGLSAPHALNLSVKTDKTRIETLLSLAHLPYPVTGWIENTLTIQGDADNPVVQGDFHAWSGSVMGELFQNISGLYSYDKGNITLKNFLAYIYEGTMVLNGSIENDKLDLDLAMYDVNLERVLPNQGLKGVASLQGKVSGTFDNPKFDGTASSRELDIFGNKINLVSTAITYDNHLVSIKEGTFRQKSGRFLWEGSYNVLNQGINGKLTFTNWDLKNIMQLFKLPGSNMDGLVNGGMSVSGTVDNPNVNFKATIGGGHLGGQVVGEGIVDFSYMNKVLSIRKLNIPIGNGVIAAQGGINSQGDLDILVAARDMDISWIPVVMGREDISVGGTLTALVTLSGNKLTPEVNLSLGVTEPRYGDILFDNFSLMANARNNVITIQNAVLNRAIYKASLKGTMPGNIITGAKNIDAVPMDLDINLDKADMNILGLFSKSIVSADGPIKGHIKVGGSYDNPSLTGGVSVKDGQVSFAFLNEPVQPINFSMEFKGHEATVEGDAKIGQGDFSIAASANFENLKITKYAGELKLHAPKINSVYYKGAIDTDLKLDQVGEQSGISGNIHIHDATIDVPLALLSSSDGELPNILTKIDVTVGDNVRLYNQLLYDMIVKGNISMVGPLREPFMTGRVNVEKGTVKINTTEFKIDPASAIWGSNPGSILPVIHAKGTTKIGHYNVTVEMDGLPGEMKTVFHSDPYLSDSQILLLLTLHQNPDKDTESSVQGALFNAGLTMILGNGVQDFLQDKIGLDQISITSSLTDYYDSSTTTNDNYYYIKIGKYIFNDFMLTATMGVNNEQKSVGFHYDLNSHMGISSWYNSNRDSYIGADWSFKF